MINISGIFQSINGEVNGLGQGSLCTFIRFSGCPVRCRYCDTKYAWNQCMQVSVKEIVDRVKTLKCRRIVITGGEPLYQPKGFKELVHELWKRGYEIACETSGTFPLISRHLIASWVVDYKLPSAFAKMSPLVESYRYLKRRDFVKFVVGNHSDFVKAQEVMVFIKNMGVDTNFAFSPVKDVLSPTILLRWMRESELMDVFLNIQIHKLIGVE